jgi:hypothetical protein
MNHSPTPGGCGRPGPDREPTTADRAWLAVACELATQYPRPTPRSASARSSSPQTAPNSPADTPAKTTRTTTPRKPPSPSFLPVTPA